MLSCRLAYGLWSAANYGKYRAFKRSLDQPEATQTRILLGLLERNRNSAWGRKHQLNKLQSVEAFRDQIPLTTFDDYPEWIERIQAGEVGVLTAEPVNRLVPSSGSTTACKLIPYTNSASAELGRAVGPWIVDMLQRDPDIRGGPAYWSVSPSASFHPPSASGPPVGFAEDAEYLGGISAFLVNLTLATPRNLHAIPSGPRFRYLTLLHWLRTPELRLISVWNPSFLTLLLEDLEEHWDALLRDVERGLTPTSPKEALLMNLKKGSPRRAKQLGALTPFHPTQIWPRLKAVSCWTDGPAALALQDLKLRWPRVPYTPKGLLATEAVVSFPFQGRRPVAVNSHFYEFLDREGRSHLVHELVEGEEYSVVVTTGAGLYRYRLQDRVRVAGFLQSTPCIRFLGKEDHISDLFGEKLNAGFVADLLNQLLEEFNIRPRFTLLAPHLGPRENVGYALFLDSDSFPENLGHRLEQGLQRNPHYLHCIRLGQLQPSQIFRVAPGAQIRYLKHRAQQGQTLGEIKPTQLSRDFGWYQRLVEPGCGAN